MDQRAIKPLTDMSTVQQIHTDQAEDGGLSYGPRARKPLTSLTAVVRLRKSTHNRQKIGGISEAPRAIKLLSDLNAVRLCGSIWPRCTMPGIFVDIYFLKATILNY